MSTLEEIEDTLAPEAVFLEASGMADPRRLLATLERYCHVAEKTLVISLADMERLEMLLEAAEPMIRAQLEPADILALNKADLSSEEELGRAANRIALISPEAKIINMPASRGMGMEQLVERACRWWA